MHLYSNLETTHGEDFAKRINGKFILCIQTPGGTLCPTALSVLNNKEYNSFRSSVETKRFCVEKISVFHVSCDVHHLYSQGTLFDHDKIVVKNSSTPFFTNIRKLKITERKGRHDRELQMELVMEMKLCHIGFQV